MKDERELVFAEKLQTPKQIKLVNYIDFNLILSLLLLVSSCISVS